MVTDDRENEVDCVHLWDVSTKTRVNTIIGMPQYIEHVRWSPDGKLLVVTGSGSAVVVNPLTSEVLHEIDNKGSRVCEADWSPDSRELALSGFNSIISIFDIESGKRKRDFVTEGAIIETLRWSPDGRRIATGNRNGHIHICDAQTGKILHILKGHRVWSTAYDGTQIYSTCFSESRWDRPYLGRASRKRSVLPSRECRHFVVGRVESGR